MRDIRKTAEFIKERLVSKGVGKYAFTVTMSRMEEFSAANGAFTLLRTTFKESLSLTVFMDGRKGEKTVSELSDEAVEKTIDEAVLSSASADRDEAFDIAPSIGRLDSDQGDEGSTELFFSRIKELLEYIKENHPKLLVMDTVGQNTHFETIYMNSNGTDYHAKGGLYECWLGFSAHEGEKTTGVTYTAFMTKSLARPFIELGSVRRDLISTERSLETVSIGEKFTGTVIFTPSCLGQFLGYLSESLSDTYIMQGVSPLIGKIGEKIADERITLTLESSSSDIVNGEVITSDGFRTEDTVIIENGILRSFLLSLYAANKTGNKVTKNSSFDIVMKEGGCSLDEMIKNTKRGLLVGGFSGGMPAVNGDFSGVAKNSFYIEDGRVKGAVTETMINGSLTGMLISVNAVSSERVKDGSTILPYLSVGGIVISSK